MVLDNWVVVCIDEFEKMSSKGRMEISYMIKISLYFWHIISFVNDLLNFLMSWSLGEKDLIWKRLIILTFEENFIDEKVLLV